MTKVLSLSVALLLMGASAAHAQSDGKNCVVQVQRGSATTFGEPMTRADAVESAEFLAGDSTAKDTEYRAVCEGDSDWGKYLKSQQ